MSDKEPGEIKLAVNGQEVPLNPYVRRVFADVNAALVSTLRLDDETVEKVELTITFKSA